MIDIHTHIFPSIDDGARDLDETLDMLKMASLYDTDAVVFTFHMARLYGFNNIYTKYIKEKFDYVKQVVNDHHIPIQVYLGMEVLYTNKLKQDYKEGNLLTINHSKYMLIEYSFDVSKEYIMQGVEDVLSLGLIPVVAHPERYEALQEHRDYAYELLKKGAVLQMNTGSYLGTLGSKAKACANYFLEQDYYQVIASDAHRINIRTVRMDEVYDKLEAEYSKNYVSRLLHRNPLAIIENKDIDYGDLFEEEAYE